MKFLKNRKILIKVIVFSIFFVFVGIFLYRDSVVYAGVGPTNIVEQYGVYSQSSYRNTSRQVTLYTQSLTSVPSIFQYSIYNNDINGGSGGTLCTFYPGNANQYESIRSGEYNYNGSNLDTCN